MKNFHAKARIEISAEIKRFGGTMPLFVIAINIQKYIPSNHGTQTSQSPTPDSSWLSRSRGIFLAVLGQDSNPGLPYIKPRHFTAP
jgi:hypothetical protein